MKRKKLIALLAAVVATLAVWQILRSQSANKEEEIVYRNVVVAVEEIQKGEVLERSKLTVQAVPSQYTPGLALESINDAEGKVAQSAITPGEMLTVERVYSAESGQAGLSYIIPENKRAITLNVESDTGVGGMIRPGNKIDLLVTYRETQEGDYTADRDVLRLTPQQQQGQTEGTSYATFYLLENVQVLASGMIMNADEINMAVTDGYSYSNVTLAVTREEAREIELYTYIAEQNGGNVRMTMRPSSDEKENENAETGENTGEDDGENTVEDTGEQENEN